MMISAGHNDRPGTKVLSLTREPVPQPKTLVRRYLSQYRGPRPQTTLGGKNHDRGA
jgi:hypothetical protein